MSNKNILSKDPKNKMEAVKNYVHNIDTKISVLEMKEEMINRIQQKTRHFAKRQLTWYRKFKDVYWVNSPYI